MFAVILFTMIQEVTEPSRIYNSNVHIYTHIFLYISEIVIALSTAYKKAPHILCGLNGDTSPKFFHSLFDATVL